jgi:hypothetical protein
MLKPARTFERRLTRIDVSIPAPSSENFTATPAPGPEYSESPFQPKFCCAFELSGDGFAAGCADCPKLVAQVKTSRQQLTTALRTSALIG